MDRRTALKLLPAALGATACASRPKLQGEIFSFLQQHNLAVIGVDSVAETSMGKVGKLGDSHRPPRLSVAPSGKSLAMVKWWSSSGEPLRIPEFIIRNVGEPERRIPWPYPVIGLAMCSTGRIFLAPSYRGDIGRFVEVQNNTPRFSDLMLDFDFPTYWGAIRTSDDGAKIVAGTSEKWTAIDVPSRRIVHQGVGHFASLTPDGRKVAYRTADKLLAVGPIDGPMQTCSFGLRRVRGVGAWSPDGKWLLVGTRALLSLTQELNAFHAETGELVHLWNVGDDWGERSFWIDRSLLDPA